MPDSITDEKTLKRPLEKNRELVRNAESEIRESVRRIKEGHSTQEGVGILYRLAGLFGQRLYFGPKTAPPRTKKQKVKMNEKV